LKYRDTLKLGLSMSLCSPRIALVLGNEHRNFRE